MDGSSIEEAGGGALGDGGLDMYWKTTMKLLPVTCFAAILAACHSGGGGSGLSVSTHAGKAGLATATSDGLDLGNGIGITRIRMAVQRISVDGGDAGKNGCTTVSASHGGDDGEMDPENDGSAEQEEDCDLRFGPFDVDLADSALTGKVSFAFDVPIPDGTYQEIKIKIDTVPAGKAGMNPVLLDLAAANASILVDGWIQEVGTTTKTPYTFSTPMEVQQKREGAITVGAGANVTLDFDPSGWFGGDGGARLDPRQSTNQGAILANIRASIRILSDDDHDGEDDHDHGDQGGHGGHGGGD
jgi:hypothetical protein